MTGLDHPNILKLIEAGVAALHLYGKPIVNKPYLVLEIAENGELFDYIFNGGRLNLPLAKFYFK